MQLLKSTVITAVLMFIAAPAFAASDSPVGTWKTIDDSTGKPAALVKITESDGTLQGKVIKVLHSDQGPHPICKKCEGKRKNQPVEGMTILWGMHRDGDEWNGGHILDPKKGKTYKCKLHTADNGTKLKVRGYIGFSLLGRTQTWLRQSPSDTPAAVQSAPAPAHSTMQPPASASAALGALRLSGSALELVERGKPQGTLE